MRLTRGVGQLLTGLISPIDLDDQTEAALAIGVILEFPGTTLDQYDQVLGKMGLAHDGKSASDGRFHWCAATDDGLRVVDVWKSRAEFDRFAAGQIGSFSQAVGFPGPPQMTFYDVHNTLSE